VALGWLVTRYRLPFVFAGIFASYMFFRWVLFGGELAGALQSSFVALLFGTLYFCLLERYADNIALWWVILCGGALGWFLKTFAMAMP
jgi:hypothetical protein